MSSGFEMRKSKKDDKSNLEFKNKLSVYIKIDLL